MQLKAAHNLISKWVIGSPIGIVRAKLILQLPGPYYFRRMGGSLGKHFFPLQQEGSVLEPAHSG